MADTSYPPASGPILMCDALQIEAPASGATVVAGAGTAALLISNTALLAALTIQFPIAQLDGQRFKVSCRGIITILTMTATVGAIASPLGSITANGYGSWLWSAAQQLWFRIG